MADLITVARAAMVPALAGIDAPYLAVLVSAASNMIIRYCKRDFVDTDYVDEVYDGQGTYVLMLRQFPIIALTSVDTVESDGTTETCLTAQFRTDDDVGEIRHIPECTCDYTYFPKGYRNILVTYKAGFADIPEDVQEACAQTVAWLYSNAIAASNVESWKLGDAAMSYKTDMVGAGKMMLPATVRQLIGPYRNVRV